MTKDISNIQRIAKDAFYPDGTIKPFAKQIEEYALSVGNDEKHASFQFLLPHTATDYCLPIEGSDYILLKRSDLKKIVSDHEISLSEIRDLDDWLRKHPLVLESLSVENAIVIFADARDIHGNEIIMSLHLGIEVGQKSYELFVDRITSVYGKHSASNLIANTARAGKKIYVNEKTQDWLLRTGVQFPALATNPVYNEYTKQRSLTLDPSSFEVDQTRNQNTELAVSDRGPIPRVGN